MLDITKYISYISVLGCKIFELFNIPVQNVCLVKCRVNDKDKIAVMCEDFLKDDESSDPYQLNV